MKMIRYLALGLAACTLGTAGSAAPQTSKPTTATPPNTTVTAPRSQGEKRVCRERTRTGSHLSNIACKTPEQWAQLQADFDEQDEYGFPGNKVSTGRSMNRGAPRGGGPQR
jgi:hypothetical protein